MANFRSAPVGTSKVNAPRASTLGHVAQAAPSHKPETGSRKWLSAKPLRSKLKFLMACVCNIAFLSAALVFFAFDFISAISQLRASSAALGKVIGANSRTVLSYGYKQSASTIIASLSEYPNIIGAGLYKPDGTLFARTVKPGSLLPARLLANDSVGTRLSLNGVMHYEPIAENGKPLGMLVFESDLASLHARLKTYGIATICILLCAALFSRWLASRLDSYFVAPVAELANVAKAVASTSDYGLRAQKHGEDEVGSLVEHFNTMLGEIQKRDAAITQAQVELESKVLMRTSELHHRMEEDKSKQELIAENESRYRNISKTTPCPCSWSI